MITEQEQKRLRGYLKSDEFKERLKEILAKIEEESRQRELKWKREWNKIKNQPICY